MRHVRHIDIVHDWGHESRKGGGDEVRHRSEGRDMCSDAQPLAPPPPSKRSGCFWASPSLTPDGSRLSHRTCNRKRNPCRCGCNAVPEGDDEKRRYPEGRWERMHVA